MSDLRENTDLEELLAQMTPTRRVTVQALEEILYQPLPVLDHGFVRVIDYMGDDGAVVQAARVSYGKGTRKVSEDQGLINYLMRNRHTTPFEMCEIKLHIKMPIFVARQWLRHRTASVNEYSARYSILEGDFYCPAPENLAAQSKANRQGRGATLEGEEAARVYEILKGDAAQCYQHYLEMLNEEESGFVPDPTREGLSRELARMNLPLNVYTQFYWKIDLHNFMHFISLRFDAHAQFEIRAYGSILFDILKRWVPLCAAAFEQYRLNGFTLSKKAQEVMRRKLSGENVDQPSSGLSVREWVELEKLWK